MFLTVHTVIKINPVLSRISREKWGLLSWRKEIVLWLLQISNVNKLLGIVQISSIVSPQP